MSKTFKTLLFTILLYFLCPIAYTQTYISPIIGYELTHYKESTNSFYFMTPPNQKNLNLLFGLELEQKLGERFALSFQHTWSKKHINSEGTEWDSVDDFTRLSGFAFRYNRNILFFKYNLTKNITLGVGHSYNRYTETGFVKSPSERLNSINYLILGSVPGNKSDYAIASSLGYQVAQFSIELQYHHTYKILVTGTSSPTLFLPPKAISLSVAYQFKILNAPSFSGWERKKGCPTF